MPRTAHLTTRSRPRVQPRRVEPAQPGLARRVIETPAWRRDEDGALWVSLPVGAGIVAGAALAAWPIVQLFDVVLDWWIA